MSVCLARSEGSNVCVYIFWIADCDSFALCFALLWLGESVGKGVDACVCYEGARDEIE